MPVRSVIFLTAIALLFVAIAAPGAIARDFVAPAFWFTPGASMAWPPSELGYGEGAVDDTELLFGGILGVRIHEGLSLEARGHFGSNDDLGNLDMLHGSGNLTWFLAPRTMVVPFLTAGGTLMRLSSDASDDALRLGGWNAGGGLLVRFTDQVGVRVDGRYLSYELLDTDAKLDYRSHAEVFAGLNVAFGGAPKDTDADGVPDRVDRCADTPLGARVDASGCPIDGDADGVPDGIDQCDGTPKGATVDAVGCPTDSDGDGVLDGIDTCSGTPEGAKVDAKGCPLDSDGDKVYDGLDQCENTPQGCTVLASGCPTDSDGDGICDGLDACADTATDMRVDAKGCPIELTEKETELLDTGMIRLQDVNFDSGKSTLKPESHAVLDEVGEILARWTDLRIEIGGHTDSQGTETFNQTLSEARARAVLQHLLTRFPTLKAEQLTSAGYGESTSIAPNDTAANRAKNRRVEFKVLNTEVLRRETQKIKFAPKNEQ